MIRSIPSRGLVDGRYTLIGTKFRPSEVIDWGTERTLSAAELAAYDAPFPTRAHMTGVRVFPSLANTVSEAPTNHAAKAVLDAFERPVLTLFGRADPVLGAEEIQAEMRDVPPGARGRAHHAYPTAKHFLQEDVGEDLARRVNQLIAETPRAAGAPDPLS